MNPALAQYIEAYTAGVISKQSTIRVQLTGNANVTHTQNEPLETNVFSFSPDIKGKAYWIDATTVEFRPDENMEPGKTYKSTFRLSKVMKVPDDLSSFDFEFRVMKPSFSVEDFGLKTADNATMDRMVLSGMIQTADVEDPQQIEKLLRNSYNGKSLPISWQHNPAERTSKFTITNIVLTKAAGKLELSWDGASLKADVNGKKTIEVPALGDFKVLDIRAVSDPEQYVLVQFSNPVSVAQNLEGLIGISGQGDLRYSIEGSEVKVFAPARLEGNYSITVNEGILNIMDKRLGKTFSANVDFESTLPSVNIPGKGVILPQSNKLALPFEAVNLKAVDVTIIKIYERNIPQYLQTNNLNGDQELRRVGKPVVEKTIRLDMDKSLNLHKRNRFFLDLEKMLRTEPGAIYRVTIGFRKSYALQACHSEENKEGASGGEAAAEEEEEQEYYGDQIDEDDGFWQRYNSYYPYGYNWEEREDPCSNSYYNKEKWASRNIITSNIGLTAKRGNDNSMVIAVTDIRDTKPLIGVELELLDYQQQVILKTKSDGDGLATFDLKRKPWLLIARKDDERGYLKLDDGSSLPLSRFDVKGEEVQNGIKGFIYGERGVWRPGDSLFLTFILEDKEKKLPENHPVTLELYNPKGQLYKRLSQHQSLNGFYNFATATGTEDLTGNWSAKVKVGGAVFQKTLKIETVKPNRLKIKLDFDKGALSKKAPSPGTLSAQWLFGAAGRNLKAKVDVALSSQTTRFPRFADYTFDDPVTHFETEDKTLFEGPLNDNGNATVSADLPLGKLAPGQLKANFEVKVFEPGGDFSIDHFSMPYNPFASYAGLQMPQGDRLTGMLLTDKPHAVSIVNVDEQGNLLSGDRDVQVELYKIRWRWWWDDGEGDDFSNFTQDSYNQLLQKETITLRNGKGNWNLLVRSPEWGRYLVRVKDLQSGHTSGQSVYIDWPGWAERMQKENPAEAAMLVFTSDKTKYNVGDEITLTIPSSEGGRGLVSIESGSRVLKTEWIGTQKGQTTFRFKAEKNMAPNIYVNVSLLQPHAQTLNDLPIRMYGTIPVAIDDQNTILQPVVKMPATLRPEQEASITVSEAKGKAMTYTIALVDEGLLDLTRFKTPDPHSVFYAREALGVKTWDLFDYVIGAWGADMDRILSIGGDEGLDRSAGNAKANRFKPVVKFMGPFYLKKGDEQTHKFKLPPYIGSVKAMVVAGQDGAYGAAEKTAAVKKPLMLLTTLPRVLGPSETIQLPVTVFGLESNIRKANVTLATSSLLEVVGERTKTVTFSQPGEQLVYFDVRVKPQVGIAKVKVTATSGSEKAEETTELQVRNPNPVITNTLEKTVEGNGSWSSDFTPVGMAGTNTGTLEVSTIPSLNLAKRLRYLIEYPHGCIEQTTSSVFPQLALNQLTDLKSSQQAEIDRNIKAGLNRIKGFQSSDGGFSYWPGGGQSDEWGTNYAGHFLLEAQAKGYAIPPGMLDQWKKYQRNKAATWAPNSYNFYGGDLVQSYRLYLLALAKVPELGGMNRLKEFKYISPAAKWRLAATYRLAGQPEVANSLVSGLGTEVKAYNQLGGTFGSDLRDKAMILETLTILGQRNKANELVKQIAAQLSQENWYSTQTTAYALIAIAKFCGNNSGGSKMNFSYQLNGSKGAVNGNSYVTQLPVNFNTANGSVSLQNKGQNVLYVRLILQGQPDAGQEPVATRQPEILGLQVQYSTRNGKALDPATLQQGTDFMATVTIRNPGKRGYYEQMALSQIFPSGWEILNTRLMESDSAFAQSPFTYMDIRDDRVYTYFNIEENKTHTYNVLLNAAYLGRYYLPATSCEAMYDNNIHDFAPGKWVEIVK